MNVRLDPTNYAQDLIALRQRILGNGRNAHYEPLTVSHQYAAGKSFDLYMNLAFDQHEKIDASVYMVAFGNTHGTWHFDVPNHQLPGTLIPGKLDGSYGKLDLATANSIKVTNSLLKTDVIALADYTGGTIDASMKASLARVIVAVCEATRFASVETGIKKLLDGSSTSFDAQMTVLHSWGGTTLGQ